MPELLLPPDPPELTVPEAADELAALAAGATPEPKTAAPDAELLHPAGQPRHDQQRCRAGGPLVLVVYRFMVCP